MRRSNESRETREERKERTRRRLLDAALDLMGDDRSFSSLSLRKVARRAGITPNAFYRHFDSMEDLGLALLDEIGPRLRRMLRDVRRAGLPDVEIVRRSVAIYEQFVREHPRSFSFVVRERGGGSPRIREAIRREMGYYANELASDLSDLANTVITARPSPRATELLAELIVQVMLGVAADILDLPEGDEDRAKALTDRFVHQLVMLILGAAAWEEGRRERNGGSEAATGS